MSWLETLKETLSSKTAQQAEAELAAAAPDIASTAAAIVVNPASAVIALAQLFEKELARVEGIATTNAAGTAVDPVQLAESVFQALAPKLAPYAQIIGVLAQHFPALRDIEVPGQNVPSEPATPAK